MFYVLVTDSPKDDDAQMCGPYKTLAQAQSDCAENYDGPTTFTVVKLITDGSFKVISVGRLPEQPVISWS